MGATRHAGLLSLDGTVMHLLGPCNVGDMQSAVHLGDLAHAGDADDARSARVQEGECWPGLETLEAGKPPGTVGVPVLAVLGAVGHHRSLSLSQLGEVTLQKPVRLAKDLLAAAVGLARNRRPLATTTLTVSLRVRVRTSGGVALPAVPYPDAGTMTTNRPPWFAKVDTEAPNRPLGNWWRVAAAAGTSRKIAP